MCGNLATTCHKDIKKDVFICELNKYGATKLIHYFLSLHTRHIANNINNTNKSLLPLELLEDCVVIAKDEVNDHND